MVAEACHEMKEKNIGALVVISDDNKPIGVLTDRDVIVRAIVQGKTAERTPVEEVMTSPVAGERPTSMTPSGGSIRSRHEQRSRDSGRGAGKSSSP
jgi:CBS-domain-containing membrane protein